MEELKHILFIDIETVSFVPEFEQLSERMQIEWSKKAKYLKSSSNETANAATLYEEKAAIFSEFAKVVVIGFGSFHKHEGEWRMRLKALANNDEKVLLNEFCEVISRFQEYYPGLKFCGHNIKEFDIPFLCRRMLINGMGLPDCMQLSGKKPWEIGHIDTLEMWKFGDYKHYTSLSLLAEILGIPSPKEDIDGSMVGDVYWKQGDLQRIGKYCMQDVLTAAKVYLKLKGISDVHPEPVFVND
ncbi:MAG: 3-5 exonuclease [Flavipsychrobacter sp.]|jgi:DNA polymerase elongation subunit (family B)|nr:3-5 exonuclease [Flavipsychrobacter sp.]